MSKRAFRENVKAENYDIVHYFFDRLDNAIYLNDEVKCDRLDFKDSTYIDNVIKEVKNEARKNDTLSLTKDQREEFNKKKQECNHEQNYNRNQGKKKSTSSVNHNQSIKDRDENYEAEMKASILMITVNRFKCDLCNSQLRHVFVAQDKNTNKKIVLGKTCVKCLVPNGRNVIETHQRIKNTCKRVRKLIAINKFNLEEHLKYARVTESSLVKQVIVVENAYPKLSFDDKVRFAIKTLCFTINKTRRIFVAWKDHTNNVKHALNVLLKFLDRNTLVLFFHEWITHTKDCTQRELIEKVTATELIKEIAILTEVYPNIRVNEITKFAIRVLCFMKNRTVRMYFSEWKKRRVRIKHALHTLYEAIHTSHIVVLLRAMYKWASFIETFYETINFDTMSPVQIRDSTNVIVSLLSDPFTKKRCFLKLSNVDVSTFTLELYRRNYIHVHDLNPNVLNTIIDIEKGLGCTKISTLTNTLSIKDTNETVFYDSNGSTFEPILNRLYHDCTVKILLSKYTFKETTGLCKTCMDVHVTRITD